METPKTIDDKITLHGRLIHSETLDGFADIEISIKEVLEEIEEYQDDMLPDYVVDNYEVKYTKDFESDIDDFDDDELIQKLENNNHDFTNQICDEDMITTLENRNYIVREADKAYEMDNLDTQLFEEISKRFFDASMFKKQEMYDAIFKIGLV